LKISNLAENVIANKIKSSIFKQTLNFNSNFEFFSVCKIKMAKRRGHYAIFWYASCRLILHYTIFFYSIACE